MAYKYASIPDQNASKWKRSIIRATFFTPTASLHLGRDVVAICFGGRQGDLPCENEIYNQRVGNCDRFLATVVGCDAKYTVLQFLHCEKVNFQGWEEAPPYPLKFVPQLNNNYKQI